MILIYPIHSVLYLIVTGLDIVLFFVLIRLIVIWRNIRWLVPVDRIGRDMVEKIVAATGSFFLEKYHYKLSEKGLLCAIITFLTTIRLGLVILINNLL